MPFPNPKKGIGFRHAFAGLYYIFSTQRNIRIHALATVLAVIVALWLKISTIEWAILVLTISSVWLSECLNTAIEAVVDLASPEFHELAKVGKDASAAAVLVSAFASILIGIILFAPKIIAILGLTAHE